MSVITAANEVFHYKNLIKQLAARDLKLRYERSVLGFLWSLLNPLVMIAIYSLFFSVLIRMSVERYPVFLVSVLLPWNFLVKGILNVSPLPYYNGYLLNRSAFPAESLIFSGLISAFIEFCLEMFVFITILVIFGMPLLPGILIIPLSMIILLLFTGGLSMFFAVAFVLYRDTQYIAGIITTAWLYLTPVFYSMTLVPEKYISIYKLNPMVHIAGCFREPLYKGQFPDLNTLLISIIISITVFILGWAFFNRYKNDFPEIT